MEHNNTAKKIRGEMLDEFYSSAYQKSFFERGVQGAGIDWFERALEKFWRTNPPNNVLEIGGGSGEHLKYISYVPKGSYISFDLRPSNTSAHLTGISRDLLAKVKFINGDASSLPFEDLFFDRVFSTCLLHHVNDVLSVLLEARRVACIGAEIAFLLPTDPGILNQIVKRVVTYPKMRKHSGIKPELYYALDHKNHISGILEIIKFVFNEDELQLSYRPLRLRSWNFNLLVVAKITKLKE